MEPSPPGEELVSRALMVSPQVFAICLSSSSVVLRARALQRAPATRGSWEVSRSWASVGAGGHFD